MTDLNKQQVVESVPQRGFFGHPKGLFTLFFTEFWERFSYYGMKAILTYYMYYELSRGGLGMEESVALAIMSIYGSLVYMSGIIGGWFADRIFGESRAIFYGGILLCWDTSPWRSREASRCSLYPWCLSSWGQAY
ncbi:proton-dependent oligopeptide transporter, POT family [Paenibacillus barengoltzii]|nr:proton-dependent oligopeptide transporter, POT family [Paenibacillus barengoltzii]